MAHANPGSCMKRESGPKLLIVISNEDIGDDTTSLSLQFKQKQQALSRNYADVMLSKKQLFEAKTGMEVNVSQIQKSLSEFRMSLEQYKNDMLLLEGKLTTLHNTTEKRIAEYHKKIGDYGEHIAKQRQCINDMEAESRDLQSDIKELEILVDRLKEMKRELAQQAASKKANAGFVAFAVAVGSLFIASPLALAVGAYCSSVGGLSGAAEAMKYEELKDAVAQLARIQYRDLETLKAEISRIQKNIMSLRVQESNHIIKLSILLGYKKMLQNLVTQICKIYPGMDEGICAVEGVLNKLRQATLNSEAYEMVKNACKYHPEREARLNEFYLPQLKESWEHMEKIFTCIRHDKSFQA